MSAKYETQLEEKDYQNFYSAVSGAISTPRPLFTTNASPDVLWALYLDSLPSNRQHYVCNACRHFIQRFGGLVWVDEKGGKHSALWGGVPEGFFKASANEMAGIVEKSTITGVFVTKERVIGTPVTGEWSHIHAVLPAAMVYQSMTKSAYQRTAELKEDLAMVLGAMAEYDLSLFKKAVEICEADGLYRGEKVLGVAKWYAALIETLKSIKQKNNRENALWLAVATAPAGFAHAKSSMIGTLLDDLKAGLPFQDVKNRFAAKMAPQNYMRAQVAPDAGNIRQAENLIEKMGLAPSLRRRYATIEEIPTWLWKPAAPKSVKPGGVFSVVTPKQKAAPQPMEVTGQVMTWEKFSRTVLPNAKSIEVKVPAETSRFMALVSAADPDAKKILQWDNPFSWYYESGIDGEMKRRVLAAGGRYENVDIRATLMWNSRDDLDLHVITPRGEEIYFNNKRSVCGGWLDVDANANCYHTTMEPVENIRWEKGRALPGGYRVFVRNYKFYGYTGPIPFVVELEVNGKAFRYDGQTPAGASGPRSDVSVFDFSYTPGVVPIITGRAYSGGNAWGLTPGEYVKVNGVTTSPNLWDGEKAQGAGNHVFFILDGCKDTSGVGRGFFAETLVPDLREIRSTLESFTANTPIEGAETATACGLGFSNQAAWGLTLRVTSENTSAVYTIDRMD